MLSRYIYIFLIGFGISSLNFDLPNWGRYAIIGFVVFLILSWIESLIVDSIRDLKLWIDIQLHHYTGDLHIKLDKDISEIISNKK